MKRIAEHSGGGAGGGVPLKTGSDRETSNTRRGRDGGSGARRAGGEGTGGSQLSKELAGKAREWAGGGVGEMIAAA